MDHNLPSHSMNVHFGCSETILFSWWQIDGPLGKSLFSFCHGILAILGMILSCIACIAVCYIFEAVKAVRVIVKQKEDASLENSTKYA